MCGFWGKLKNNFSDDETQVSEEFTKSIQNKKCTSEELNECISADSKELHYMHLNILLLPYDHDELHTLLSSLKVKPKILAISESRIRKNSS